LYLTTVIDIAWRRVVGWPPPTMRTDLPAQALNNAIAARRPTGSLIFHSDRGSQYTSAQYADLARRRSTERL
jgi:transposase InsO family protein